VADEVLDAVRELLPAIAARSAAAEQARELPAETIAELGAAGVFRMLQPARYGGLEAEPVRFYRVVRELAAACASTGWVSGVLGVHPWQLGLFDDRAQAEVWGADPAVLVASSYAPLGRLTPVDGAGAPAGGGVAAGGGYRLSGRWGFASGCAHASWCLLGALVVGAEGRPVDFMTVLVPRADYRIADVWDVVGLRGTGSNDVIVRDVFVPAHRTMRNYEQAQLRGPGQKVNTGPLYRMPFATIFTSAVAAPVIGAVSGGYERYLEQMRDRSRLSLGGGRFAEDHFAQVAVARAASQLDAAILQTDRNVTDIWARVVAHEPIPMRLRLRARRDQVMGVERAVEAIDLLFKTAGGNSLRTGNPIERAWRDAHAGSVHVANDADRALAFYGRGEFGLTVEDNLV
jgi:3-hydroxy-9,10-secoandrosta-1,3,5(10)-triene-9,17-dione monooxygenase